MLSFGEVSFLKVWRSQSTQRINYYSRKPGKWLSWSKVFKYMQDKSLVLDDAVNNLCLDVHITLFTAGVVFKWNGQGPSVHCKRRVRKFMKYSKFWSKQSTEK